MTRASSKWVDRLHWRCSKCGRVNHYSQDTCTATNRCIADNYAFEIKAMQQRIRTLTGLIDELMLNPDSRSDEVMP